MNFPQFAFNNVRRNARAYIAYFLSSSFMVMIFFAYSVFIYHPGVANSEMGPSSATSMQIAAFIVYIFAFFFVLYSISSFLKSRNLEFGLLTILGARPGQINKLIFMENMLIGFFAIVTGLAGGMLLSKLFLLLSTRVIGIDDLPFYWPVKAILITSISFISLFLVISIFTLLFIRKNRVLELLQGNAKPKKQPKASILLTLLGTALLATGFFTLQIEIGSPTVLLVAAITGIAGTYFFYSQLSVFIVRLLQRSRKSTWRGTRLLWISEMSYKLRDNSRILFMITVVTALASMGAGVVLSLNQAGRDVYHENPFSVNMTYYQTPDSKTELNRIHQELEQAGVEYTEIRIDTLYSSAVTGDGKEHTLRLMGLQQFNKLASSLGLKEDNKLGRNEAILIDSEAIFIDSKEQVAADYVVNGMVTLKEQSAAALTVKESLETDAFAFFQSSAPILVVPEPWMDTVQTALAAESEANASPMIEYAYKVPAWDTGALPKADSPEAIAGANLGKWNAEMSKKSETPFFLTTRANTYMLLKQSTAMISFVSIFVALIFSVSSASFLYFKLHSELTADIRMYRALSKIGLSTREMSATATKQIAVLFYIPVFVSALQSYVVVRPVMSSLVNTGVGSSVLVTFAAYLVLQSVFFLIVKSRYIWSLKKMMV
ncbi:ABC transporter permease [Paenibacillus albidus]|uniref:ABC transporter permease n=1 Tax=Paenibacillus albidus TaxID=2041023 RepID=A0A917CX23_9BACL|nr:ABC transporter permease [Paenibacillus albidus]GGG00495.1 ABC transporter permease [Paenibacillus albidus]